MRYRQSEGKAIIIFNKSLDCGCSILKVLAEDFALSGQVLHSLSDFYAIHGSLSELLVFRDEISVDAFEPTDMLHQILDHEVCSVKLLHQQVLLIVACLLLPLDEGAEHGAHAVILSESQSQTLTGNIMLE